MRACDLTAGMGKLEMAAQSLSRATRETAETWNDQTFRDFEEMYVTAMDPKLKNLLDAVRRLAEAFAAAEHECGDRDHV
ncbi:MAG: hypothetical protein ACLQLG_02300 [Thermoguttaceae bacterium]